MSKILIVDIETTGFLNQGGSIVEIGAVELDLSNGNIKEVFNSLCRESILTREHGNEPFGWIFKNSNLTLEEVRFAPKFEEVKESFQKLVNQYESGCTAFNNKFDFDFLEDRGVNFPVKLDCPMLLSTPICELPNKKGWTGFKWPKVEEAFKHFFPESDYVELHRGADDAKHEAMIVYELYKIGVFKLKH